MTTTTAQLAELVSSSEPRNSTELDHNAIRAIIDSVGVVVAGRTSDAGTALGRWATRASGNTREPWWEVPRTRPPEMSALVTSTCGHALDFDDVLPGAGHPSSILLSAILASPVAELSGRQVLDAFIIGYEVNARLAKAVGHQHYRHGWHTTCTIGGFGATAAVGRVLRLDAACTRRAFGIAASLAGGLQRNFGSMTKPLHSGLAAHNGVLAAQLAATGFSADEAVLDGQRGFLDVYSMGAQRCDALHGLGQRWAIREPGPTLKKYACALEVYRVVEASLALRVNHQIDVTAIKAIRCLVPPGTLGPLRDDDPTDGLEAKFSLSYAVASAMVDGDLKLHSFTDGAVARAEVRDLMTRISASEDIACRPEDPSGRNSSASFGGFVRVEIETHAGERHSTIVHDVIGSPARPLSDDERRTKLIDCVVLGGGRADAATALFDELSSLPTTPDTRALLRRRLSSAHEEPE